MPPISGKAGDVMSATLSHCGLPVGIQRSRFIGLIRPALKARGLKTSAIRYLAEAFDKWTRDQDYEPGRICGFWHQVSGLAEELTCTERTVHSIERDLEDAQLVSRHPKANGRRDGLRDGEGEKIRDAIRAYVISKIELRQIRDHNDVLAALKELEEDGMEIKPPRPSKRPPKKPASKVVMRLIGSEGTSQTYRLTDRIFHEDWTCDEWVAAKNTGTNRAGGESVRRPDLARAERLRRSLEKAVARRAGLNRERYERSRRAHARRLEAASEGGSDPGGRGPEDDARDAGPASALAEQRGVALHRDAHGDRRGSNADRVNAGLREHAGPSPNTGGNSTDDQRAGELGPTYGPRRCWNGPGPARWGGAETMPAPRARGPHLRQNTKNGGLNVQPDTYGARIAEIRQSVDRALRQISQGYQAFRRQDIDGNATRHGVFERVREALSRVSDAIGGLVSRLRRGSGNRWFCDARVGGSAARLNTKNRLTSNKIADLKPKNSQHTL